jgi:hypothetical protein
MSQREARTNAQNDGAEQGILWTVLLLTPATFIVILVYLVVAQI